MRPDLIVIGAGPAGVAAALWARSLELGTTLVEREAEAGGQLHWIHFPLRNVPAAPGVDGAELAARLAGALEPAGVERVHAEAVAIDPGVTRVRLADGRELETRAVLLATGARRRVLEVPGVARLTGHGVSTSATRDRERFSGRAVVVVGGGDAAYENAIILADAGCRVTLVVRGVPRARARFRERVARRREIEIRDHVEVTEVLGGDEVTGLGLRRADGAAEVIACAGVVIKIGMVPNSERFRATLEHDPQGYVRVDAELRTSHPGVWAAGDITRPMVAGIPVAWGQGVLAVESIRRALGGG